MGFMSRKPASNDMPKPQGRERLALGQPSADGIIDVFAVKLSGGRKCNKCGGWAYTRNTVSVDGFVYCTECAPESQGDA